MECKNKPDVRRTVRVNRVVIGEELERALIEVAKKLTERYEGVDFRYCSELSQDLNERQFMKAGIVSGNPVYDVSIRDGKELEKEGILLHKWLDDFGVGSTIWEESPRELQEKSNLYVGIVHAVEEVRSMLEEELYRKK